MPSSPNSRIPVIAGPTAGGKSALALELAKSLGNAEIVTADAYQIYMGMDIGTAKPTIAEREGIPHHLIDLRDPRDPDPFTVHDWLHAANAAIADIQSRGKLPIVVGGTHLYIKSLLDGLFDGPGADPALRDQLRAKGLPALREELERVDPQAAQRIHPNDERRTIRALEVFHLTGKPISAHQTQWNSSEAPSPREGVGGGRPTLTNLHGPTSPHSSDIPHPTSHILIGLDWPSEKINPRINARVKHMMESGFLEEVRTLHATGAFAPTANPQAREALGYKQLLAHIEGRMSLDDAIERIKIDTRHFAKTQRTWLKRLRITPGSMWIDASGIAQTEWAKIVLKACTEQTPRPPQPNDHPTSADKSPQPQRFPARRPVEPIAPPHQDRKKRLSRTFLWIVAGSIFCGLLGFPLMMLQHGVLGGIAFGLAAVGLVTFAIGTFVALFKQAKAQHGPQGPGFNACPKCGYHLQGLPNLSECPECGCVYTRVWLRELRGSAAERDNSGT